MTSEGHYAGMPPAEATSGGPTSDDFPPDADGRRAAGRASAQPPADGFPSSYAPPPQATPNGGSPFVVPAVSTFGSGSDAARPATPSGTSYGSARVPQPEAENGSLPQRGASPYGSVSPGAAASTYGTGAPNAASSPFAPPGSSDSPFVPASGNAPEPPRSAWAPQQAPAPADGGNPFPLPQRTPAAVDPATIGEFDGFAAGTPGRGTVPPPPPPPPLSPASQATGPEADPAMGRPPGLSAFGDQRVRVPGATLGDLPGAPPAVRPRTGDSGGFPQRGAGPDEGSGFPLRGSNPDEGSGFPLRGGNSDEGSGFPLRGGNPDEGSGFPLRGGGFPTRRGESGGFPLRGAATVPPAPPMGEPKSELPAAQPPAPVTDLPIRSQHAPFGPPAGSAQPEGSFSAFGPPPGASPDEQPSDPYGRRPASPDEQSGDPYGRRLAASAAEQPSDPYGRRPAAIPDEQGDPFGRRPAANADQQGDPFGRRPAANADQQGDPFGRRPGGDQPSAAEPGRAGLPDPFGRPAPGEPSPGSGGPAFGSARPQAGSPFDQPAPAGSPFEPPAAPFAGDQPVYGSARPASPAAYESAPPAAQFGSEASPLGQGDAEEAPPFAARPFGERPVSGSAAPYGERPVSGSAAPYGERPASGSAKPFGERPYGERPASGSAAPYGERPASPFGEPPAPFAERPAASESPFGERPGSAAAAFGERPASPAPFGERPASPAPFGERPATPFQPEQPAFGAAPDAQDEHTLYRRPETQDGGYPQRVPGASLGAAPAGSPIVAESRNGSVPAPRDPAEHPAAVGSARPVTASASVPSASRVAPVDPGEIPPPVAAPQARVYGRPAEPADEEPPSEEFDDRPAPGAFAAPGGFGSPAYPQNPGAHNGPGAEPSQGIAPQSPARATARASASARVAPPSDFPSSGTPGEQPPFGGEPPRAQPPFGAASNPAPSGPQPGGPAFGEFINPAPSGPQPGGPAFGEFINPAPSGPGNGYPPEQYSELTTDIAGRDNPYAPPAAFPPSPNGTSPFPAQGSPFPPPSPNGTSPYPAQGPTGGGPNGMSSNGMGPNGMGPNGIGPDFSGAASRATVTPPSPDDTTNWPSRPDQGRFDQFKPATDGVPAKPNAPRVRMLPILIAVVVGAVLLLGVALGVVYLVAGDKSKAISVSTGDCVKRDGNAAVKADCGDASAFTVVSIVDDHSKCEDAKQPYVQNPTSDGKTQILCLKPKS